MGSTALRPCGDFRTTYKTDQYLFQTKVIGWTAAAALAVMILAPVLMSSYVVNLLILVGISGISALGLNVLVGMTGQISLGHAAFYGFGAFSSAYLANNYGVPVLIAIPLAGVMTAIVGMVFGLPAARIKGLYLAIATLASQFILVDFFSRATWFTNGYGVDASKPDFFGIPLDTDEKYFYVVLAWAVISMITVANLKRSRDGRALVAVRDHYLSAEIMGINLTKYRILAFGISSFFAGVAGALYAHYIEFVSVETFSIALSINFLAMIIIGGLGSVPGAFLGAMFIELLPQLVQIISGFLISVAPAVFGIIENGKAYVEQITVGTVIILFLIFEPEGIAHRVGQIRKSIKLYPFSY